MSELLTCPFCGGKATMQSQPHDEIDTEFFAMCLCCACEGPWFKTSGNAIREWNRRAPDPEIIKLLAQYAEDRHGEGFYMAVTQLMEKRRTQ